jgi:MFS family permease
MAVRTHQIPVPHPRQGRPGSSRWFALAVLCVSILMVNLDNTVLNVALPTLVRDLHATSSQLQWIVDAYMLVFGGLLLVAGSLADRVGRKRTFLAGLVAFAGGSAWSAFSGSVGVLIAAQLDMRTRLARVDRKPNGFLLWVMWISCSGHWPTRPGGRCLMSCSPGTVRRWCPSRRGTT